MKKCAVIFFHSNIDAIYKKRWIDKCIDSILNQTYQDFDVFEIDYSGNGIQRIKDSKFFSVEMQNHIFSMNFIISEAFDAGYEIVFNTNMDDFYAPDRFAKQLERIELGFQIVSSNFFYITEIGEKDICTRDMNMFKYGDIRYNLNKNHNVIAHPCVAMHRSVWDAGFRYNESEIGFEDLSLWKKVIQKFKFSIMQDYLLYYRIHNNQITKHHKV